jgi:hypothetical protein
MLKVKLDIDPDEFAAWLRGEPKSVAVPKPPPSNTPQRSVKSITMLKRDTIMLPELLTNNKG